MDVAKALEMLITLTGSLTTFALQAQQVSEIVKKAQDEGRDKLTDEEWKQITDADDAARDKLLKAISG